MIEVDLMSHNNSCSLERAKGNSLAMYVNYIDYKYFVSHNQWNLNLYICYALLNKAMMNSLVQRSSICTKLTITTLTSELDLISGNTLLGTSKNFSNNGSQSRFSIFIIIVLDALVTSVTCLPSLGPPVNIYIHKF